MARSETSSQDTWTGVSDASFQSCCPRLHEPRFVFIDWLLQDGLGPGLEDGASGVFDVPA